MDKKYDEYGTGGFSFLGESPLSENSNNFDKNEYVAWDKLGTGGFEPLPEKPHIVLNNYSDGGITVLPYPRGNLCPNCGYKLEKDADVCTWCGTSVKGKKKTMGKLCKHCSFELAENATVCDWCGKEVESGPTPPKKKLCKHCGFELVENAIVCEWCGKAVDSSKKLRKRCKHCGFELTEEAIKCEWCGNPVNGDDPPPPPPPPMKYCQKCGFKYPKELENCPQCGWSESKQRQLFLKIISIAACCTMVVCLFISIIGLDYFPGINSDQNVELDNDALCNVLMSPILEIDAEGIETPAYLSSIESRNGYEILSFKLTQDGAVATIRVYAPDVYSVAKELDSGNTYTNKDALEVALDNAIMSAPIAEKQIVLEYELSDDGYAPILTVEFLDAYYGGIFKLRNEIITETMIYREE